MISTKAHLERLCRARKRGTVVEIHQPEVESRSPQFEFDMEKALRSPPDPAPIVVSRTIRGIGREIKMPVRQVRGRVKKDDGHRYLGELRPRIWNSALGAWVYL